MNPISINEWNSYYSNAPDCSVEQLKDALRTQTGWTDDYCILIIGTTINEGYPDDPYLLYAWASAMIGKRNSSAASYDPNFATDAGAWNTINGWDPNGIFYSRANVYSGYNSGGYPEARKAIYLAIFNTNTNVSGCMGTVYQGEYAYYTSPVYCPPRHAQIYVKYIIGRPIDQGYDVYADTGFPTKLSEFRAKIFHALSCDTDYYNRYPYNLGYWHGNYFSFDCVNLLKAILCGWYDNRTVGYFQADLSRTGDVNEWDFIQECGNVSQNFAALTVTSALYMSGHIGCFVGEYERNGKIYNTIECTAGSIGTGVVSSYVDSNGWRYPDKSKPWTSGRWTLYGDLTPWLVYDVGNIDPGGNISPVNPGGGGVDPPGWQNPQLKKNMPVYMMLRNPRLFGNF